MNRLMSLVLCGLVCVLVCMPLCAEDPPKKLTPDERKELEAKWEEIGTEGLKAYKAGKYVEAQKAYEETVRVARRLYPKSEFPDGHAKLGVTLQLLGIILHAQRKYEEAEPVFREAVAMHKRLYKNGHPVISAGLHYLADGLLDRRKPAEAEPLLRDALEWDKRLHKEDHRELSTTLAKLAASLRDQEKFAEAESVSRDALAMLKRMFKGDHPNIATGLNDLALILQGQGKLADAAALFQEALRMMLKLYKGDHPELATALGNVGEVYEAQGRFAEAELLLRESLNMRTRLYKGDHPRVALSLNRLGELTLALGKLSEADTHFREGLDMRKRLFKGDSVEVAVSIHNLATLCDIQRKDPEAEKLFRECLDMRKRLFKGDHAHVALTLNNLGTLSSRLGKRADAMQFFRDSLEMYQRVYKRDHPDIARGLNNMGFIHQEEGKAEAARFYRDSLAMDKRLHTGDHPDVAGSLAGLAFYLHSRGELKEAAELYRDALAMSRRLVAAYASHKSEGESLTLAKSLPAYRDLFLSNELARGGDAARVYSEIWADKGVVARVYEQRQLQSRAAAADPAVAKSVTELADIRRRRAELLLGPVTSDPTTRKQREDDLKSLDAKLALQTAALRPALPALARIDSLNAATVAEFQKTLPADVAVVDYVRFLSFEFDKQTPGARGAKATNRFLAFVVTKEKVEWLTLEADAKIESVVTAWREAITSGKEIPAVVPAKVRELVWEKVRKALPANIKAVYVCPDADLCKVPFAALPGDKPGTILLEDFAVATIPHAPFLLDKLWPQDPLTNAPEGALVVGGVKYDAELTAPVPNPSAVATRGNPLVKPDQKLGWSFLDNTVGEANGVTLSAERKKLSATRLEGDKATPAAVLAALPKAKYTHLATHGFFADPSFLGMFQLDPKDYEQSRKGERIGRAANSPLVMTGLVFAGANNPKTPGRGILTGEQLVDLHLSGLELAVLSACETGLGDVAGGEGTFGLQRAFHYAGTRNVVASLWKVPDAPTAALMNLFYQNLWDKNLSPVEALRQAQLEVYKNPQKIPELAKGFRGKFEEVPGTGTVEVKPVGGKAHPLLWAAFTLSGPGR